MDLELLSNTYLLSPTIIIGLCALNAMWFSRAFFLWTIICEHIGWYLSTFKSNTCTLPSTVTAAKTVLEYGAHATSPTCEFKSSMKRGCLRNEIMAFY